MNMTERPTPETDKFVEPFNARELLVTARRLERERDEARENARRRFVTWLKLRR